MLLAELVILPSEGMILNAETANAAMSITKEELSTPAITLTVTASIRPVTHAISRIYTGLSAATVCLIIAEFCFAVESLYLLIKKLCLFRTSTSLIP